MRPENNERFSQQQFEENLQNWVSAAPESEIQSREEARNRIINCKRENTTSLNLSNLALTSLPEEISDLTSLETLHLASNALTNLPAEIGNLTSLINLQLSYNRLTPYPEAINNLTSLRYLNLSYNRLTTLPETIGNLTSLDTLNLSYNQLTTLPDSMINLTNLSYLSIEKQTTSRGDFIDSPEFNRITNYNSLSEYFTIIEERNRIKGFVTLVDNLPNYFSPDLKTYISGFNYSPNVFPNGPSEKNLFQYIESIEHGLPALFEETAKACIQGISINSLVNRDANYRETQQQIEENCKNLTQEQQICLSSKEFQKHLVNHIANAYEAESSQSLSLSQEESKEELKTNDEASSPPPASISPNSTQSSQVTSKPSREK